MKRKNNIIIAGVMVLLSMTNNVLGYTYFFNNQTDGLLKVYGTYNSYTSYGRYVWLKPKETAFFERSGSTCLDKLIITKYTKDLVLVNGAKINKELYSKEYDKDFVGSTAGIACRSVGFKIEDVPNANDFKVTEDFIKWTKNVWRVKNNSNKEVRCYFDIKWWCGDKNVKVPANGEIDVDTRSDCKLFEFSCNNESLKYKDGIDDAVFVIDKNGIPRAEAINSDIY